MLFATLGIALATITAGIVVWQTYDPERSRQLPVFPEPSPSPMGQYDRAAVSCDAPVCADIGKYVNMWFINMWRKWELIDGHD